MAEPNTIDVSRAMGEIAQACENAEDAKASPFFFIVGAGVSTPPMPLARDIEAECMRIAKRYGRDEEPPASCAAIDKYSHWFERAFPHPGQRQRYLRALIEGKPISHATLRLAHLLGENKIATLVVTPNFDDFLSRALTLFGKSHVVSDHPATIERIDPESTDIQIVHVHGTYWFYDCCNLRGEIERRTDNPRTRAVTITSFLDMVLARRSPLVVGYSGWESDVIMKALERRLRSPLRHNLYWFCYRQTSMDELPDWLRSNPDVRFVVRTVRESESETVQAFEGVSQKLTSTAPMDSGRADEATLPARRTFDMFAQSFSVAAPRLTKDPLGFFIDRLQSLAPEALETEDRDVYQMSSVIARIERAREAELTIASTMEAIRDGLRRSDYVDVLTRAKEAWNRGVDRHDYDSLAQAVMTAATGLGDNSDLEIDGYDLAIRIIDALPENVLPNPKLMNRLRALRNKGVCLVARGRYAAAVAVFDEILGDTAQEGANHEALLHRWVSLAEKGSALIDLERFDEAVACFDELFPLGTEHPSPEVTNTLARCLVNKAISLYKLGRYEQSIETAEDILRTYSGSVDKTHREASARALVVKALASRMSPDGDTKAAATYDEMIKMFSDDPDPEMKKLVAGAILNRALIFDSLGEHERELEVYDELLTRFESNNVADIQDIILKATCNRAMVLDQLGRPNEALDAFGSLWSRYGEFPRSGMNKIAAESGLHKSILLSRTATLESALQSYEEVILRLDANDPTVQPILARCLLNRAELLIKVGSAGEARKVYTNLIRRFGTSEDTKIKEMLTLAEQRLNTQEQDSKALEHRA